MQLLVVKPLELLVWLLLPRTDQCQNKCHRTLVFLEDLKTDVMQPTQQLSL